MFDYETRNDRTSLAKPLTICAVGMGIGFGTCGVGLMIDHDRITPIISGTGAFIFFASLLGLLALGLFALGRALLGLIHR